MIFASIFLAAAAAAPQNPARVDEIAGWLQEKPGLYAVPASDRASWKAYADTPEGRSCIKAAKHVSAPVAPSDELYLECSRNGNRSRYQNALGHLLSPLGRLVMAEALEGQSRFTDAIAERMEMVCSLRSWVLPAHDLSLTSFNGKPHIDLVSSAIAADLAAYLAVLGDRLPAGVRAKVRAEIDRRVLEPYLQTARDPNPLRPAIGREHWWFMGKSNWNSVCNDCSVRAALLVVEDKRVRAEFCEAGERSQRLALQGYADDGYCLEGMGYWNYGFGHYVTLGLALRMATGGKLDIFADPKVKRVMEYGYGYVLQDGKSPFFADGGGDASRSLLALGRQVWPDLSNSAGLKYRIWNGSEGLSEIFLLRAFGREPPPTPPTRDILPDRTWFPDAQVLISRCDRKGLAPFSVAIKGGHNAELHNHNDLGSYSVMFGGTEVAGDPGGEIYTRWTFSNRRYLSKVLNSFGHPVPVADGALQSAGRKFAAKVLRTDFGEDRDEIDIDITGAYEVTNLVSLVRKMTLDRKEGFVEIEDKVEFSKPSAFESPLVTYADVRFDYEPEHLSLRSEKGGAEVQVKVSGGKWKWATELIENPQKPSPKRIAVRFLEPVSKACVSMRYTESH